MSPQQKKAGQRPTAFETNGAQVVHGLAAPAMAAINPQIEVSDLSLTKVNAANEEQSGQLYVKGLALLTFNWDASKTTPKEGDSFAISLPAE